LIPCIDSYKVTEETIKQKTKLIVCYEQNKARANSVKGIVQQQLTGVDNEINWVGRPLKGQCQEIFYSGFFYQTTSPSPVRHTQKGFQIFSNIR
jgi:hypothetical protein